MNTRAPIRAGRILTGWLVFQVLLALSVAIIAAAAEPSEQQGGSKLKVMTYNVYAGTKYAGATDPNPGLFLQATRCWMFVPATPRDVLRLLLVKSWPTAPIW